MKKSFDKLFNSIFRRSGEENFQSANIHGDGNTIHQTIIINPSDSPAKNNLLTGEQPLISAEVSANLAVNDFDDDDSEEIRKILDYRKIADSGQGNAALDLLDSLKSDAAYSSGYFAFRLYFNIGVILQNIGKFAEASDALRQAYEFFPEHNKAKTAKAFAELLVGNDKLAYNEALELSKVEGDHRSLAISILFHAAKRLRKSIDVDQIDIEDKTNISILVARLEYLRVVSPKEYSIELEEAYQSYPDESAIASMWALGELDDMKQNMAFLLGAKMPEQFESKASKCAEIFYTDITDALKRRPPNMQTLASEANNAAVALRLSGDVVKANRLIENVVEDYPELADDLLQVRASLLLQQDKDDEALKLIEQSTNYPELQIMASELEAVRGNTGSSIERINTVLATELEDELRFRALIVKTKLGISAQDQDTADEALEDLAAIPEKPPELLHLQSAYDRAFNSIEIDEEADALTAEGEDLSSHDKKLIASLSNADEWEFITVLQVADELYARDLFRECAELLKDRVSFSKESPALSRLCEACIHGSLGTLAKEISSQLSKEVQSSVFGIKFTINVAYLSGEALKAIPLTRQLFQQNPYSISSLERYIQALLRTNDRNRLVRVVRQLPDAKMQGTIEEQRSYVNLLVHCGEIERARIHAYKLYCKNQNDHRAWLALSSSVLAFGKPNDNEDQLSLVTSMQVDCTMEVEKPDGTRQVYTIESDEELHALRESNISPNHPIAVAAMGKKQGDSFNWPLDKLSGEATILWMKHKALAAFHNCLNRFEEQFPNLDSFKSVSINFDADDGLDEMKSLMRKQADYAQQKAQQYHEGQYPLHILAHNLGIDPIDAFLGLKSDCGYPVKVTSCTIDEQNKASEVLKAAKSRGIICDATVCYLIRRLQIEDIMKHEFGAIGVTQHTTDVFANRLARFESSIFYDSETGEKKSGRLSMREEQLTMSEQSHDDIEKKLDLLRSDLDWLEVECETIPSVAKADPPDVIIQFRQNEGGRFFDDIFAADGSERVLISEDHHVRLWARGYLKVESAWLQALIHHLEEAEIISPEKVVSATLELIQIGEHALTTNSNRLLRAAKMWTSDELSEQEFGQFSSVLGQDGADLLTHWDVGLTAIRGLWHFEELMPVREKATSILLRHLLRIQHEGTLEILDALESHMRKPKLRDYLKNWRVGHFLTREKGLISSGESSLKSSNKK